MPNIRPKDIPTTASYPAPDDWEILDGTVNGTRKLAASYRDTQIMTRAPGNFLQSDAATSNRGVVYTGGTRQNIAGVPVVEIAFEGVVPGGSATQYIWASNSDAAPEDPNCTFVNINATGAFLVVAKGADLSVNQRDFRWAAFRTSYPAGTRIRGSVVITQGTTNPVVRINGVDVSANFTLGSGSGGIGAAPQWLDSALSTAFQVTNFNFPAQECFTVTPILGSLSTTERDTWFTTGRFSAWVHGGGNAAFEYTSDFSSGVDSFANGSGEVAIAGNIDGIDGQDDWLRITRTAVGSGRCDAARTLSSTASLLNRKCRILARIHNPAGSTITHFFLRYGGYTTESDIGISVPAGTTADVVVTRQASTSTGEATNLRVIASQSSTDASNVASGQLYYIKLIRVGFDGALTLPGVQGIGVVRDLTTIGGNQGRLVGITPCLAVSVPMNSVERPAESYTAATSVQLLGGAITGGRKRRLVSVSGNSSASVNLSLGTSSGGTQLVNAQAVNGDFDISTFASRILAANSSLWLTFSGNTTASIVIQVTDL